MSSIDILTSPTLKHLREHWWNDSFTQFLSERLRPRPGNRILDVGCGEGLAEIALGRVHRSQIRLAGVDISVAKVAEARRETAAHNQRVFVAAGDAVRLPFATASFDSTYCVAVMQHIADVESAVAEFARVTRPQGRVVVVEPDNAARYVYSSIRTGAELFAAARELFAALAHTRRESTDAVVGPRIPERFARHGIEPMEVRVFPVSHTLLGAPSEDVWASRRRAMEQLLSGVSVKPVTTFAERYFDLLARYEREAAAAGGTFVEIQTTPLFATVGQRIETEA